MVEEKPLEGAGVLVQHAVAWVNDKPRSGNVSSLFSSRDEGMAAAPRGAERLLGKPLACCGALQDLPKTHSNFACLPFTSVKACIRLLDPSGGSAQTGVRTKSSSFRKTQLQRDFYGQ